MTENRPARCGTRNSGISVHVRGWKVGVEVRAGITKSGDDILEVFITRGSQDPHPNLIGHVFNDTKNGLTFSRVTS